MQFDWSTLGARAPTTLVRARILAHHACQWVTKAARANLPAIPDDSHCALEWVSERGALFSLSLPANGADVRIGLSITGFELIIMRDGVMLDTYSFEGRKEGMTSVWFDSALRALGLKPASNVTLPYSIPHHGAARGGASSPGGETEGLAELARWFDAGADVLEEVKAKYVGVLPGASPVHCWPHHFDIATLISFEDGDAQTAKSLGVGLSPGDEYYAQPYVYVNPWPRRAVADLPPLPPPGHWHTQGFVGAVATGEEILTLADRRSELLAFIGAALDIGSSRPGI